jgi:serine/threonine-protein kinase
VAAATDFGRLPNGSFFLIMEYVDGRTLRRALADGPFEPERALHIVRGIASALMAAHTLGIVHRDIKPENVMLVEREDDTDFVKVLDFGIAKVESSGSSDGPPSKVLTKVGAVIGTPHYMSPEQALGQDVDGRSDLYAVGIILFEMLTGHRPFQGGAVTQIRQHVLVDVPQLPPEVAAKVPPRAATILARLVAKAPEGRYADASELIAAIDGLREPTRPAPAVVAGPPAGSSTAGASGAAPDAIKTLVVPERRSTSWTRMAVVAAAVVMAATAILVATQVVEGTSRTPSPEAVASGAPSVAAVIPPPPERATAPLPAPSPPPVIGASSAPRTSAPALSIVRSQFAEGNGTYWMDVDNPGAPTTVTLVWKHDGKEVAREALHVGKAPRWRTWGATPRRGARVIDVAVLDPQGRVLKTDTATVGP